MKYVVRILAALLIFTVFIGKEIGSQPPEENGPVFADKEDPAPGKSKGGDPTSPSPLLKDKLNQGKESQGNSGTSTFPTFALKGRMISSDDSSAVLVEVNGEMKLLQKGNQFTAGGYFFQVLVINRNGVTFEIQPLNKTFILN